MVSQSSSDLKLKAVKYYKKLKNYVKVCKIFECSERSLKRWIERYDETGSVDRKNRTEGSYKMTNEYINFVKNIIKNDNSIQMKELHEKLKDRFKNISISRQYLSDLIRNINITRKRATFEHFPKIYRGNPRNEKEELSNFFNKISKFQLKDIISIDETSISTSLKYNYCREKIGDRCIIKTDDNSVFEKYSLLVAICNSKCLGYKLYENGAVNSVRFDDFMTKLCINVKNKLIILDNGQIHKKESTKKIIKDSSNYLVYTCPYHPRLNCIEQWFNQLKHYIKHDKPNNYNELKNSLVSSILKIKKEHYENYFTYAYNKDYYKNNKNIKISSKHRKSKIYKN